MFLLFCLLIYLNRVGVDALHTCVVKSLIQNRFNDILRWFSVSTVIVAGQRPGGNCDISHHENDQNPGDDFSGFDGDFFDPLRKQRITDLQPDDGGNSPEETVQQVDSAAELNGMLL